MFYSFAIDRSNNSRPANGVSRCTACVSSSPGAFSSEMKLSMWNILTLKTPGTGPDRRTDCHFVDLVLVDCWNDCFSGSFCDDLADDRIERGDDKDPISRPVKRM